MHFRKTGLRKIYMQFRKQFRKRPNTILITLIILYVFEALHKVVLEPKENTKNTFSITKLRF